MLNWLVSYWRSVAGDWRRRALKAEERNDEYAILVSELEVTLQHHHAVDAVHALCGKEAMAANWGLTCPICMNDGHLAMLAKKEEFEDEVT